jgi:hypothetical protein
MHQWVVDGLDLLTKLVDGQAGVFDFFLQYPLSSLSVVSLGFHSDVVLITQSRPISSNRVAHLLFPKP